METVFTPSKSRFSLWFQQSSADLIPFKASGNTNPGCRISSLDQGCFTPIYIYIYIYTCIFENWDRLWCYALPLQNLIPDIRVVVVTCNNCNPPSMSFQDWVSRFSVQPRKLILPFPYYFLPRPRNREREKIKEREREVLPSSSLFQHHQKGNKDKTSLSTSSFLDFRQQRGEEKKLLFIHTFFLTLWEKRERPILFFLHYLFPSPFYLCLRGFHHQIVFMDEEEEAPIAVDAKIARKSLLPLQDSWYCSSPLFPVVSNDIGAFDVPS